MEYLHPKIIDFSKIGLIKTGFITVVENSKLPFNIKRVYWTYNTPETVIRGYHSHKELEQIIFAVHGSIDFELIDKHGIKYQFKLDSPDQGLYIPAGFWRSFKMADDAVLLCLASEEYNENDYIRNYNDFINS